MVSLVAGPSDLPWVALWALEPRESREACLAFEPGWPLGTGQACDPGEADFAFCSLLSEESLYTWYSGRALFTLQAGASWQVYCVPHVTQVSSLAHLAVQTCSSWGPLVAPTSCESWESDDARGTSHPWEPWQAGYAGDADVTLDSLDVAGSPGQPRDACQSRDPWHSLDTFQAQVPFESHGSFVSFLPFDIFHSWQDDGRGSWGAGVPSAAFVTWLSSWALLPSSSKKSRLAFDAWQPGSAFEPQHTLEAIHPWRAPLPFWPGDARHANHSFKSRASRLASLARIAGVPSVPSETFHAHGPGHACVTRFSSLPRQTFRAWGPWAPKGSWLANSSGEPMLSRRALPSLLSRRPGQAELSLEPWHPGHPLASPEPRGTPLSRQAF